MIHNVYRLTLSRGDF